MEKPQGMRRAATPPAAPPADLPLAPARVPVRRQPRRPAEGLEHPPVLSMQPDSRGRRRTADLPHKVEALCSRTPSRRLAGVLVLPRRANPVLRNLRCRGLDVCKVPRSIPARRDAPLFRRKLAER